MTAATPFRTPSRSTPPSCSRAATSFRKTKLRPSRPQSRAWCTTTNPHECGCASPRSEFDFVPGRGPGRTQMADIGANIEFDAEGVTLRGLFFAAAGATRPAPCVVMAHGWAGEITHFIADFARTFSAAGIAAVVFDYRGWRRSDAAEGKPRHESEPWEQIRDYQHAITYAQNRQDVDPDRIGAWGSSYSAGHAFVVAAIDRRVKAVVGQVPVVSGLREFQGMVRVDIEDHNHEAFAADRRSRARGEPPTVIPGGHFDAYRGHAANIAQTAARDWFVGHLTTASTHRT